MSQCQKNYWCGHIVVNRLINPNCLRVHWRNLWYVLPKTAAQPLSTCIAG